MDVCISRCKEDMVVATFGLGFGDGLPMSLANKGFLKNKEGKFCFFFWRITRKYNI